MSPRAELDLLPVAALRSHPAAASPRDSFFTKRNQTKGATA
jgi:hypothetical protein